MTTPSCPSNDRHGSLTARTQDGCRCPDAVRAHNSYEKRRAYDLARGRPRMVDSAGTVRRLQALTAIGWPHQKLAAELGVTVHWVRRLANSRGKLRTATARSVADLYDRLGDHPGPSVMAAASARQHGYQPPVAWDADEIDDPAGRPWAVIDDWGNRHHRAWPCARPGCRGWAVAPGRIPRGQPRPRHCSTRCAQTQTSEGS